MIKSELIWIESFKGPRSFNNILLAFILLIGGFSFVCVGLSSYLERKIIFFLSFESITFTPQGLVMLFYGIGSIFFSLSLWAAIFWNIGSGYNEFDKKEGFISLFRWGYPGKSRRIRIRFLIQDIQAIELNTNQRLGQSFFFTFKFRGEQNISLMPIGESFNLQEIEEKAAQLSRFLKIPIQSS